MINNQQISDRTGQKLSEVQTFFCRTDRLDGCAESSFEKLPPTYSQPLKIISKLWSTASIHPAVSMETMDYDNQGRAIRHIDAFGRLTQIHYCPKTGDIACPATPNSWPLSALKEWVTTYPAKTEGQAAPPPVTIHNYYRKVFNHTGQGYTLVLDHQMQQAGQQYITTTHHYYQDHKNTFTYGLLRQTILTDNIQRPSALTSVTNDYYYRHDTDNKTKTTYSAIEYNSGKRQLSPSVTTSLFTNQVLQSADSSGRNIIRYHYDLLGRTVQTDLAVRTSFVTSSHYKYTVSPTLNQVLVTAASGLQQKTIFDSAGRILVSFNEALSEAGKAEPGHWFPVQKTTYDTYGRITAQYGYIIEKAGKTRTLTTTQDYDDSGRVVRVHLPDGQAKVTLFDDADRCVISYQQSNEGKRSSISVMRANVLYKPVMHALLPASDAPLPAPEVLCNIGNKTINSPNAKISTTTYDGFGRMLTATDPLKRVIKKRYNALGEVTDITDPVGDTIHSVYDLTGHVIQSWALPASGGHYLLSSGEYNAAGQQLWSAGEDKRHTTFTYAASGALADVTTPTGHKLTLQYNDTGQPVTKWLDGKLRLQLHYHPVTARMTDREDVTGKTSFTYDIDGLIRQLIHSGKNGYPGYQLKWQYDQNRRIISVTDIADNQIQTSYDALGRTAQISYQPHNGKTEILTAPVYDDFSRIKILHYGSTMERKLSYDTFGHPLNISDTLSGKPLSTWSFNYDGNDNITTLVRYGKQKQYARLHYQYDALNNLVTMTCNGSSGLSLCPRDTTFTASDKNTGPIITRQDYTFTPLNRLARVQETLQNPLKKQTLSKVMYYGYTDPYTPMRLQQISTAWNQQSPVIQHFSYDILGNMTVDGEGNHIRYNAFSQIEQVVKPDGKRSNYAYDGNGKEAKETSTVGLHYLFYHGSQLLNEQISAPGEKTHMIGYLGVAKTTDGSINEYEESNYKGDVVGVLTKEQKGDHPYKLQQCNIHNLIQNTEN